MQTLAPHSDVEVLEKLQAHEHKDMLRFITCGSVDDGKSSLIGRLLYDSQLIYDDQLSALARDSKTQGTQGDQIDFALLVDGLASEREQGITIDVAYRFFATPKRKFIVADTPGHEQYTRNMATGASTADLAVLLVDARKGLLDQTRRHATIVSLLGIKHVVVAINKMDLIDYDQSVYNEIEVAFRRFATPFGFQSIEFIPVSALLGDNVTERSDKMDWYRGPALLDYLETVKIGKADTQKPFRLPVQWVNRPNSEFRGFSGTIASGQIRSGDEVIIIPSGKRAKIKTIVTYDGELPMAVQGMAVNLVLDKEVDVSRGDIICAKSDPAGLADQFQAHIVWMSDMELYVGRQYLLKTGNKTVPVSITNIKHRIDITDMSHVAAKTLSMNEIGVCTLSTSTPIAFDPYSENPQTGSFILIDRATNETAGAGTIDYALRRARNVVWQDLDVSKKERADQKHQTPALLWFTGLSGSGKSTIANLVEKRLFDLGYHTYILDGDNMRHGLNKDLGFTKADRIENIRRIAETGKLMVDAGLITLASFISPYRQERQMAREMLGDGEFIEIFVNTPLSVAEARDTKGLYAKARAGQIKNFTGIDSEYQAPQNPEIEIDTTEMSAEHAAELIVDYMRETKLLKT